MTIEARRRARLMAAWNPLSPAVRGMAWPLPASQLAVTEFVFDIASKNAIQAVPDGVIGAAATAPGGNRKTRFWL